ncbi:hypothetical protein HYU16_00440 [Candidatus Woesearchaeota archaeon]|nr:hypothetical protein [Candidatus Woesearchaeota archaeon]
MNTLEHALKEALKLEGNERIIVDTSFVVDLLGRRLWALLAAEWASKKNLGLVFTSQVEAEYRTLHRYGSPDREGIPKAQAPLETMGKAQVGFAARAFMSNPPKQLSGTDVKVAEAAVGRAAETRAKVYVATADYDIPPVLRTSPFANSITCITPDSVERNIAGLLPELDLELLIRAPVLADIARLASGELKGDGMPFLAVSRKEPFSYGGKYYRFDTAMELRFKWGKMRSEERRYDVPIIMANALFDLAEGKEQDYKAVNLEFGNFAATLDSFPEKIAVVSARHRGLTEILQRERITIGTREHMKKLRKVKDAASDPAALARMVKGSGIDFSKPYQQERLIFTMGDLIRKAYLFVEWARIR